MDRMHIPVDSCGAGQATSPACGTGGPAGDSAPAGDADPEIAIAIRAGRPGLVALYWHGVPNPAAAAAVLALAGALGPVVVQRVIVPDTGGAADADRRLPRPLARVGAEVVLCMGADQPRLLAAAWHALVVDDLARHPGVTTVVLAGAPQTVAARVAPVVRAARYRCVRLRLPAAVAPPCAGAPAASSRRPMPAGAVAA